MYHYICIYIYVYVCVCVCVYVPAPPISATSTILTSAPNSRLSSPLEGGLTCDSLGACDSRTVSCAHGSLRLFCCDCLV